MVTAHGHDKSCPYAEFENFRRAKNLPLQGKGDREAVEEVAAQGRNIRRTDAKTGDLQIPKLQNTKPHMK
jgi:hypothetical protein